MSSLTWHLLYEHGNPLPWPMRLWCDDARPASTAYIVKSSCRMTRHCNRTSSAKAKRQSLHMVASFPKTMIEWSSIRQPITARGSANAEPGPPQRATISIQARSHQRYLAPRPPPARGRGTTLVGFRPQPQPMLPLNHRLRLHQLSRRKTAGTRESFSRPATSSPRKCRTAKPKAQSLKPTTKTRWPVRSADWSHTFRPRIFHFESEKPK